MPDNNEENNLDSFFKMIDSVEDDISEMLEGENSQLSGYECLVICFNYLRLYCGQIGIKFGQIEDHYNAFKESNREKNILNFNIEPSSGNGNEVEDLSRVLEEVENCLTVFEQRCKKTGESFDAWNCVFIMYSYLKKHCDETKTNYAELMSDVSRIQSDVQKNGDTNLGSVNSLN